MTNATNATLNQTARQFMFADCDDIERSIRRAGLFTVEQIESIPSPAEESRGLAILATIQL